MHASDFALVDVGEPIGVTTTATEVEWQTGGLLGVVVESRDAGTTESTVKGQSAGV